MTSCQNNFSFVELRGFAVFSVVYRFLKSIFVMEFRVVYCMTKVIEITRLLWNNYISYFDFGIDFLFAYAILIYRISGSVKNEYWVVSFVILQQRHNEGFI